MADGKVKTTKKERSFVTSDHQSVEQSGRRLRLMTRKGPPSVPCCVIVEWVSTTICN